MEEKKSKAKGRKVLAHIVIILCIVVGAFLIFSMYNPRMGFLTSTFSKWIFAALTASSLILALITVTDRRR